MRVFQSNKKSKNWLDDDIKTKLAHRDTLKETAKNTGKHEDWLKYRQDRNRCIKDLRRCKEKYHNGLFEEMNKEHDTKKLYRLTNKLLGTQSGTSPQQLVVEGKTLRKPLDIANAQLTFYETKIANLMSGIVTNDRNPHRLLDHALSNWEEKDARPDFEFRRVSLSETETLISTLSNSSAAGHDGLDTLAIKAGTKGLVEPICHLINTSLSQSKFCMKWKLSGLTPRLKSKELDRDSTSSYRPVAVLPSLSKVVERAAQQQLLEYFERTNQLNPSCHAYRKSMSTTTTLCDILDDLYQGIEENKLMSIMAVDQSSAFECIDKDLLLEKMQRYGIGMNARNWIEEYLSNRTQYVTIGKFRSRMSRVTSGVPQGSVMGPLLFAIFTNDVTEVAKDRGCQEVQHQDKSRLFAKQCEKCGILTGYADDLTYTIAKKVRESNQASINRVLDEMTQYLNDNRLVINLPKTQIIECMISQKAGKTQGEPPSLSVRKPDGGMKTIYDRPAIRILGANISKNLLWTQHLETGNKALLPQVRKIIGMFRHLGGLIPLSSRNNLAKGVILSRLQYLMPHWGGATESLLNKTQIVLNTAARWVTGLNKRTRVKDLMLATGWMNIREQVKVSTAVQTWKVVHQYKPLRMRDRWRITPDLQIEISRPRLEFTENCYRWRGPREWNSLDTETRHDKSLSRFKRRIRRLVLDERDWDPGN